MAEGRQAYKVFNDPVHGHVELHPLLVKIIDTPQFQRLRHLKQLGGADYVYPGATHTRFEHSIGVAHLAGQLAETLRTKQPELKITPKDVLCVQIAGLCHDLGHGPFSHLFDGLFLLKAREGFKRKHEDASLNMFDHMVEKNGLETKMEKYDLVLPEDLVFIKDMIHSQSNTRIRQDMSFLYEIVANETNGIDVDKFDYFARDCYYLGIQNNFDLHRFLMFARVCEVNGKKHICSRDKEVHNLYNMFYTRSSLHRRAYQHKVVKNIQIMIADALLKADKHIKIKGSGGKEFSLSEAVDDMEAYTKLTDRVFEEILYSSSDELKEAREILDRIITRKFYRFLGQKRIKGCKQMKKTPKKEILSWKQELARRGLSVDDFEIIDVIIHTGRKDKDPMNNVYFYRKDNPDVASEIPTDERFMVVPQEHFVYVFYKKTDEEGLQIAKRNFEEWSRN